MTLLLASLGIVSALIFLATVLVYVRALTTLFEQIGGNEGTLDAVITEHAALAARMEMLEPELTRFNDSLDSITDGLASINGLLAATVATLRRQGGAA